MKNPLIIVFTLFNESTASYLSKMGLTPDLPEHKAVGFHRQYDCLEQLTPALLEQADVLLLNEDHRFSSVDIGQLFSTGRKVFQAFHSRSVLDFLGQDIPEIRRITSLQFHHNEGEAFDFLTGLGKAIADRDRSAYDKAFVAFLKNFEVDVELETQLELLNAYGSPAAFASLLKGGHSRLYLTERRLRGRIMSEPDLRSLIRELSTADEQSFPVLLNRLEEYLFPGSLKKPE